jgi:putative ABC transport system permease protein
MEASEKADDGLSREDARYAAGRAFGSLSLAKEDSRAVWGFGALDTLWQDLRYGGQTLLKKPGFTAAATLTLALGIGANTSIFSVVDAVLLKPLPYREPDRLVSLSERPPKGGANSISAANFLDWRNQNHSFERVAAFDEVSLNLTGVDRPEEIQGVSVSAEYFNLLGVGAAIGRTFLPEEELRGGDGVVILSHRVWRGRFGADPGWVGRTITLNGEARQVVGVLPPDSDFDRSKAEMWIPLSFRPDQASRDFHFLSAIARLKPGVTLAQARADMDGIAAGIEARFPKSNRGWGVVIAPMRDRVIGPDARRMVLTLLCAVGFILLVACANVANLTRARGAGRQKEVAIRAAIGAGRPRLIRQFLTESVLLSATGGAVGLLLGLWLIALFNSSPNWLSLPTVNRVALDHRALLFTLGVSLLTGMVFGAAPAWQAASPDLNETLKEGGRGAGSGRSRLRSLLVVSEVALALVLLIGAGLLIRSLWSLLQVKPGFSPDHVLTMRISLPGKKYSEASQIRAFFQEAQTRVQSAPGVQEAGLVQGLPLLGWNFGMPFAIEGRRVQDTADRPPTHFQMISPSYFSVMGIPILKGRNLTEQDRPGSPPVALINQTLARRYFADQEPIGKRLLIETIIPGRREFGPPTAWEIVGVIGDVKVSGLDAGGSSEVYVPFSQSPLSGSYLVARTKDDPAKLVNVIQQEIHAVDKDQPMTEVRSMGQVMAETFAGRRSSVGLVGAFAAIALALAAVGIYGVISYTVAQRSREIGLRMALGANSGEVFRLAVKQALALTLVGVAIGLAGALALTRVMQGLLFGVSPTDPVTFGLIPFLITGVALAASYLPARRAASVDPLVALRAE